MRTLTQVMFLTAASLVLSACSGGGSVSFESNARKVVQKGSPFVSINQGGRALIIEQGKTADTGVHGWVSVQSVAQRTLTSPTGVSVTLNKARGPSPRDPASE